MNAARAKRRWLKWCRYVDKTGTQAAPWPSWRGGYHNGQAKAYGDAMFARRGAPKGARYISMAKWMIEP